MITINRNPYGDTRTAKLVEYIEDQHDRFVSANKMHIRDMQRIMRELGYCVSETGNTHDCTKTSPELEDMFFNDFCKTLRDPNINFTQSEWYQLHVSRERHHLNAHCPKDVDLIDVLEMIADCVCAGAARNGEVQPVEISNDILQLAVKNTTKRIKSMIRVTG